MPFISGDRLTMDSCKEVSRKNIAYTGVTEVGQASGARRRRDIVYPIASSSEDQSSHEQGCPIQTVLLNRENSTLNPTRTPPVARSALATVQTPVGALA